MAPSHHKDKERREFFRYGCDKPVKFTIVPTARDGRSGSKFLDGVSKNLSASGILFTSKLLPEISSIVALKLDYRTTNICSEIEEHALIIDNVLVGKVVRIDDNNDGTYNIGVAFMKRSGDVPPEIRNLVI
jgi:uncharacterized protein YqgV (UPF0045/DUF77 family)